MTREGIMYFLSFKAVLRSLQAGLNQCIVCLIRHAQDKAKALPIPHDIGPVADGKNFF